MLVGLANKRFLIGLRRSWPPELNVNSLKVSFSSLRIGNAAIVDRSGYMWKLGLRSKGWLERIDVR